MKKPKMEIKLNGINIDEESGEIFSVFFQKKGLFKKAVLELFLSYSQAYRRYKDLQSKVAARCLMVQEERGGVQKVLHFQKDSKLFAKPHFAN